MSAAKYQAYKDSGIPWIGSMPAHWEAVPYKHLVDIQNGADHKHIEQAEGYPVIGSGGVFAYASEFIYEGDSVLLGRKGTIDKPLFVSGRFWTVDTMYWTKIAQDANPRFAYYTALTIPFDYYATNTALPSMTKSVLHAHLVARPPKLEQAAIAAFLDRETAKIDSLVEEQRRLIELLKEKRQAVISRAVTKGLNPNAPMKDSGVEWLGKVPAHWTVSPLKHVVNLKSGGTPDKSRRDYWDGDIPWASAKDLKVDALFDTIDHITEAALEDSAATLIDAGIVLVVVRGMILARLFPVVTAQVPMAINQDLKAVSAREPARNDWLAWLLRASSVETLSRLDEAGHGTKALRMDAWGDMRIAVPPPPEQLDIAAHLRGACARVDELIAEAESAIKLLAERRAALICAAVTGKIDVRDSADLLTAWAETKADIAAGRFVTETAKAHVARARAMVKRDD